MTEDAKKPLGRILLKQHAISEPELDRALAERGRSLSPLATRLTESGTVSEIAALKALSEQSGVPGIDLSQVIIRLIDLAILPREVAVRHRLLPVLAREDRIFVAMASPTDKKVIDELEFVTGKRLFPYIALVGPLMRVIHAAYDLRDRGEHYYVGPNCPPEVQRKAGLVPKAPSEEPAPLPLPASVAVKQEAKPPEKLAPPAKPQPTKAAKQPPPPPPAPPPAAPAPTRDDYEDLFESEASMQPSNRSGKHAAVTLTSTPVILDDAMGKMAAADELSDLGFGDANRDQSVVTTVPTDAAPRDARKTMLIVDDELEIRRLLRRLFEERGFRVLEADRGLLALRLVKDDPPDVLILDAMLPEVHGFDIAKRMKGAARYAHIPIIMVSAVYRGWRIAEDLKASYGVDAYLEKPFKMPDMIAAVDGALAKRGHRRDEEQLSAEAERELTLGIAAYKAGDVAKAVKHLEQGTKIDPLAYRLHYHLGLLCGKEGRLYDAIQALETALQISGRQFPALKNLAILYQQAGFRNKAIETWERALAVAPDDATRQSIKEHLLGLL